MLGARDDVAISLHRDGAVGEAEELDQGAHRDDAVRDLFHLAIDRDAHGSASANRPVSPRVLDVVRARPKAHRRLLRRVTSRITLAGLPRTSERGGITVRGGTSEPAATSEPAPMTALSRRMLPIPMRQPSPTVHPWRIAPWPTVTSSPTIVAERPSVMWTHARSWTLVRAPMRMATDVAAEDRAEPHARFVAELDVADERGVGRDEHVAAECAAPCLPKGQNEGHVYALSTHDGQRAARRPRRFSRDGRARSSDAGVDLASERVLVGA